MFDQNFDEPNYNAGGDLGGDYNYEGGGNKKLIPIIAVVVVLIVVAVVAMVFLGGQQEVTIKVSEVDGSSVSAQVVLTNSEGVPVLNERGSTHTITLGPGTYNYTVSSSEHKTKNGVIVVSGGEKIEEEVELERNFDVELSVTLNTDTIYEGEEISGNLIITNTGDTVIANEKLIADDKDDLFDITFSVSTIGIQVGGATGIDFTIKIREDISSIEEGDIDIKLKGSKTKETITLSATPAVSKGDIKISGDAKNEKIDEDNLVAGERTTLEIQIKNNNKTIDVSDIDIEIIANSGYEDKIPWFEFGQYSTEGKNKINIDRIAKKSDERILLHIDVPVTAKENDEFRGVLKISSKSIEEDVTFDIILVVETAVEVGLALSKNPILKSDCDKGGCDEISSIFKQITLKNVGNQDIQNISIAIEQYESEPDCIGWFDFGASGDKINELKAGEEKVLNFTINPFFTKEMNTCYLEFTYDNPLTGFRDNEISDPIKIELTDTMS